MQEITQNVMNSLIMAFAKMEFESESARIKQYKDFTALYDQDYDEIVKILYNFYLEKPFSADTLDRMPIHYDDIIEKVIQRKTAGLISKQPSIELVKETEADTKELFDLKTFLEETNLFDVIQDALQKAEYYNTVILQPVYREDRIQIDVLTPDECIVKTAKDYLRIKEISVARTDENGEIYASYWDKNSHYIIRTDGEAEAPEDNPNLINPYGLLPFVVFRRRTGKDFWGEPNWGLYHEQLSYLMSKNDTLLGEYYQKFPLLFGVNYELGNKVTFSPGEYVNVNNVGNNIQSPPNIQTLNYGTDWANIRENAKARLQQFYINQGLPASSMSADKQSLSGDAKEMDEKELEESRDRKRASILKMIKELLNITRVVWNYHKQGEDLPENGYKFKIQLNDQNIMKSPADIKAEREMQKAYGIADEIDFIMQDLELTEEEAIEHFKKRKERMNMIETGTKQPAKKVTSILDFINAPQDPNATEAV